MADRAAAVPGAALPWPAGTAGALLMVGALGGIAVVARSRRRRAVLLAVLAGAAVVVVPTRLAPPGWPPAGWVIVACDVGQGDAVVLATARPGWVVLVDAGPADGPIDACLARLGVRGIALVLLSHLHADHVGGLAGALRGRAVGAIARGPGPRARVGAARHRPRSPRRPGCRWSRWRPDGGWRGPASPSTCWARRTRRPSVDPDDGTAVNDGSLVVRATTPAGTVLLAGDAELAEQADLLATGQPLRADILKMPHHGSRYSSPAFLAAVAPRVVLVSVGAGNTYGQPNLPLLAVLERAGAVVRRTDTVGRRGRHRQPSRWRAAAPNCRSSRAATRRPPAGGGAGSAGGVVPAAGFEPALSTT